MQTTMGMDTILSAVDVAQQQILLSPLRPLHLHIEEGELAQASVPREETGWGAGHRFQGIDQHRHNQTRQSKPCRHN
jgi:hypothetical protein